MIVFGIIRWEYKKLALFQCSLNSQYVSNNSVSIEMMLLPDISHTMSALIDRIFTTLVFIFLVLSVRDRL